MRSLRAVEEWPVDNVAVAVVDAKGTVLGAHGSGDLPFKLASVTKMLTAYTVLIAVEEGAIEWDYPVGPPGSTLRHLIAHASGLSYDKPEAVAEPGRRRLYSNAGYNLIAETIASVTGISFTDYAREAVFTPLHMYSTVLDGSAAASGVSTCSDLTKFAAELQAPTLVSEAMMAEATTVAFPGLSGVLPGLGYQKNNDWGLGFELRDHKSPHWTGANSSPRTFGHFGQSGTFLWVDPDAGMACVALTDRSFGNWAKTAWPAFTDAVLAAPR